jgi:CheY-like chemotaxis protein
MPQGKILVVDDDPDTVQILTDLLSSEGYDVVTAYTGKSALEKVKSDKPDLVILDIMMPNMDGLTVCQRIKDNPETKDIKIIILTSKDSSETLREAVEKKADWFIAKPYGNQYLVSMVAKLLAGDRV